jgi:hypothetical protein
MDEHRVMSDDDWRAVVNDRNTRLTDAANLHRSLAETLREATKEIESLRQRLEFVQVVNVEERTDGTYVFANLDDARAFEVTVDPIGAGLCLRREEVVCDHADTLKLIAAECEATPEAEAASLESGVPVATHAWKKGENAPYPDKLEAVRYVVYPTDLDKFGQRILRTAGPRREIVLWVGLDTEMGCVNVDAGRERLESEGWEVTDSGAA